MIYVIATLTIKPGSSANVLEAATPCIAATRNEPGCISYDLSQSLTDENVLVFVERWKSHDDLKRHFTQPHMAIWRERGGGYVVDKKIEIIDPENVKVL